MLIQNKYQNKYKIDSFARKCRSILDYFELNYSFELLGELRIVKKKINSFQQIQQLPSPVIFNCMGVFSKKIFKDENLFSLKGSMLFFKNSNNVKDAYRIPIGSNDQLLVIPKGNVVIVGVTKNLGYMDSKEDRVFLKNLYNAATQFFTQKL